MGARGNTKTGGRTKGSKNIRTILTEMKAIELGVDPFIILLQFAAGDYKALKIAGPIDPALRMRAAAEACQYLQPKLRSVDGVIQVKQVPARPLKDKTDEELDAIDITQLK